VPTVREPDGLAMSSRNAYLDAAQRAAAPTLYRALNALAAALAEGQSKARAVEAAQRTLAATAVPEYFEVVDAQTFEPIDRPRAQSFVIGAMRLGGTRLIDNLYVPS
jgi:pantoate--beta-alanine ligase